MEQRSHGLADLIEWRGKNKLPLYWKKISPAARKRSADCGQTGVRRGEGSKGRGLIPFTRKDPEEREIVCTFKRSRCFSDAELGIV